MYKLKVQNGDFVLGPNNQLMTVKGKEKLVQDLRLFLQEPLGTSFMTPRFGSSLNSTVGRDSMGRQQSAYIGTAMDEVAVAEIVAEVDRVLSVYQQGQVNTVKDAKTSGMLYMFSRGEILNSINEIESTIVGDMVVIKADITTGAGENIQVTAMVTERGVEIGTA